MRKLISLILCIGLCIGYLGVVVRAEEITISPRLNNIAVQISEFKIIDKIGTMIASYDGYEGIFESVTINITLKKRFLWVFWNDVDNWTFYCEELSTFKEVSTEVGTGTYKAVFEYSFCGINGESDVITQEIEHES